MEIFSLVGKIALDGKAAVENALKEIDAKAEGLSGRLEKVGSVFGAAGKKMTDVGKSMSLKVTAPIAAIGAIAAKTGMEFDAAMSEVGAISGATGEDLKALEDMAKEMGRTTKFSASEAAEGLKYMAMAGWDTQQQLDGLPGILNLAAASGEDLGTVSDIVTDAMTAFGMEAAQAGEFADVLAAAASNSNTNVSMLGESFKYVAPVAGALGFEARDTAIALGLMANAGIKGSQAGTAMRTLLTNLVKPTKESATAMDELGISLTDTDGNMKELSDVMGDLRGAFRDLDPDQQAFYAAQIAGQQGMSGLLAIVNAAEDDFNDLSGAINNSTGEAERMAAEMQDNLAGRLTELKSAIEGVALQIYDIMLPAMEGLVAMVQKAVDWFSELSPGMQRAIVVVGALAAAIGPVLVVLGSMANGISAIIGVLPVLGAAFTALTGPIGLVVAAVTALIAIGVALYRNWDVIKERAAELGRAIAKSWEALGASAKAIWDGIKNTVVKAFQWMYDHNYYFEWLADFIADTWQTVSNITTDVWNAIMGFLADLWSRIYSQVSSMWNKIYAVIKDITDRIKSLFTGLVSSAFNWGKNLLSSFIDGVKSMFGRLWDTLSSVGETVSGFLGFHSPTKLGPGRFADEWAPNFMEMFADGLRDNMHLIKDAMGDITAGLQPATAGVSNTYGGHTININVSGGSDREQAENIMRELQRLGVRF